MTRARLERRLPGWLMGFWIFGAGMAAFDDLSCPKDIFRWKSPSHAVKSLFPFAAHFLTPWDLLHRIKASCRYYPPEDHGYGRA